ncbi:hypothetical protein AKJ16_DCAP18688 [Drosera capensis]
MRCDESFVCGKVSWPYIPDYLWVWSVYCRAELVFAYRFEALDRSFSVRLSPSDVFFDGLKKAEIACLQVSSGCGFTLCRRLHWKCICRHRLSTEINFNMGHIWFPAEDKISHDDSRPCGTEALPKGIIASTSDLEMRPLWGSIPTKKSSRGINLLALAVGIKQKANVNEIVKKFLSSSFVVMLFHYDGNVNDWRDMEWSFRAIHVSAVNQTKWWFAKRFLHPDIVHEYSFIFLWDEDLGVQNFDVRRYLSIIKKEGLEIPQPALDPDTSEIHHPLTARKRGSVVHRSINQPLHHGKRCDEHSTGPPCSGMVEMMAPVFSRASWRCTWNMIQGNPTEKIGIVDSEYVAHYGLPTLGGSPENEGESAHESKERDAVRKQAYTDLERFKYRWRKAVKEDKSWVDRYRHS